MLARVVLLMTRVLLLYIIIIIVIIYTCGAMIDTCFNVSVRGCHQTDLRGQRGESRH